MFGLGKHIRSRDGGIGAIVSNDHGFGRTWQLIDRDDAVDLCFRQDDEDIARTEDLVDMWNFVRSVGHCADRLCTTHLKHPINTGDMRGRQYQWRHRAACWW